MNVALVSLFGIAGAAVAMIVSSAWVAIGALRAMHLRVAPIQISAAIIRPAIVIVAPLAVVSLAPSRYQLAAVLAGGVWLMVGAVWSGMFGAADLDGLRTALGGRSAGAAA
jgi:hypothetical protein